MARRVVVVPHSHWDREWYQSYQQLRLRLVQMLDELLPRLESDPSSGPFLLDGQLAVIDDYLEVRPEAEATIRRLAAAGRLSIGPWYVLMDEFLVSGETLVRNLQLGMERAVAFGGALPVGYLPDMFGHVAQMPQLLRQAGLEHAVVWRGVPAAVDRTAFWWRSPDGSTVRAEYLPVGYGIGAHLPTDQEHLIRRMRAEEAELGRYLPNETDPILLMNGTDHQLPQAHVPALLDEANREQKDFAFELTALAEYVRSAPTEALPSWTGELRSGYRANMLMGVTSNRVDVRVAAARAERALEQRAEPLAALWAPVEQWPGAMLDRAWLEVIRNAAHDSICACSADEVVTAVLHRYATATAIADGLAGEALAYASLAVDGSGPVVVNPGQHPASGVVELSLPGVDTFPGAQVLEQVTAATTQRVGVGADLARFLGELTAAGWLVDGSAATGRVDWAATGVTVELHVDAAGRRTSRTPAATAPSGAPTGTAPSGAPTGTAPSGVADQPIASVLAEAWAQAGANRDAPLLVSVVREASQRVAVRVPDVAGYGWSVWAPTHLDVAPVRGEGNWLDNGLVHLAVSPADGTFAINGLSGLDRLIDDGDAGDTYNYSPPATDDVVDRPQSVDIECLESGPVRGRIQVRRRYRWPASIAEGCRVGGRDVEVSTDLELRAGERLVRVTTTFDNPSRDHRLRAWFPLPARATESLAESAFAIVRRGIEAEGGHLERALATAPARRFVSAGGLTLTHEGVAEYELVDDGWALALTLLRATGILSQPAPTYRPNAAGPAHALEGPQLVGPRTSRYGVAAGDVDPYRLADQAWLPLEVVASAPGGSLPSSGTHLTVTGAEVTAVRRAPGGLEVRVCNPSDEGTLVSVDGRSGWLVDLRGQPVERWDSSFVLRAWGIATARIDEHAR